MPIYLYHLWIQNIIAITLQIFLWEFLKITVTAVTELYPGSSFQSNSFSQKFNPAFAITVYKNILVSFQKLLHPLQFISPSLSHLKISVSNFLPILWCHSLEHPRSSGQAGHSPGLQNERGILPYETDLDMVDLPQQRTSASHSCHWGLKLTNESPPKLHLLSPTW